MSTTIMADCWPLQMPPTAKAVLISLADNANDHGDCWPSIAKICERTCFKKTAVIDAIAWLETHGALQADRTNGRHTEYVITPHLYRNDEAGPVRETDRSAKRTGTRNGPKPDRLPEDRSAKRTAPVRQTDTNRQEPSLEATVREPSAARAPKIDLSAWPEQPSPKVLSDWLAFRKSKRAPVSGTVIEAFGRELRKAHDLFGMSVDQCLETAMLRNWQGFNADWLDRRRNGQATPPDQRPGGGRRAL